MRRNTVAMSFNLLVCLLLSAPAALAQRTSPEAAGTVQPVNSSAFAVCRMMGLHACAADSQPAGSIHAADTRSQPRVRCTVVDCESESGSAYIYDDTIRETNSSGVDTAASLLAPAEAEAGDEQAGDEGDEGAEGDEGDEGDEQAGDEPLTATVPPLPPMVAVSFAEPLTVLNETEEAALAANVMAAMVAARTAAQHTQPSASDPDSVTRDHPMLKSSVTFPVDLALLQEDTEARSQFEIDFKESMANSIGQGMVFQAEEIVIDDITGTPLAGRRHLEEIELALEKHSRLQRQGSEHVHERQPETVRWRRQQSVGNGIVVAWHVRIPQSIAQGVANLVATIADSADQVTVSVDGRNFAAAEIALPTLFVEPDIDCVGSWLPCGDTCRQLYEVQIAASGAGVECPHRWHDERFCSDGDCTSIQTVSIEDRLHEAGKSANIGLLATIAIVGCLLLVIAVLSAYCLCKRARGRSSTKVVEISVVPGPSAQNLPVQRVSDLDVAAVQAQLRSMGLVHVSGQYISGLFSAYDTDRNGLLDVQEFDNLVSRLRREFEPLDKATALAMLRRELGLEVSSDFFYGVWSAIDANANGVLEAKEFEQLVSVVRAQQGHAVST